MSMNKETSWFIEQVRSEQSRLRAFIRALGVRAEAVDDVAQDALLIAYEQISTFRRDEDFGAWVRGIARRLVMNLLRKENRRRQILSDRVTEVFGATSPEDLHPLVETLKDDQLTALRSCLDRLDVPDRQLLHLRYFENIGPGVIASTMDCTANEIRQKLFRLRRSLLGCIERRLVLQVPGGDS